MTINRALDDFTLSCEANGLSAVTIKGYRTIVGLMTRSIGDVDVSSVTKRTMLEYVAGLR